MNVEGFIKYSSVLQGNIADCQTLSAMIDKLVVNTVTRQAVVVLDAGIATEDNLALLRQKGYQYLCVSRAKPKEMDASKTASKTSEQGVYLIRTSLPIQDEVVI